ncbi:hypothetical protein [Streptomyces sp. NL15-2K]|uniref:hypothetical protein n=1 Tax=Streptomyces sp. NL15-2K TaxID=376149 RepID=UPI000FF9430B|nr:MULTISPECIES: hypothetical protein [Actinomycetes]WKX06889.1 hypothetical protein Q4V64_05015 [Kutzneria buriramensis]GCB44060.1 hypothetical protein SNL152K_1345 [Streptomyces sp. NL15-2K]
MNGERRGQQEKLLLEPRLDELLEIMKEAEVRALGEPPSIVVPLVLSLVAGR